MFLKKRVYSEEKIAYARIIGFKIIWFQLYFAIFIQVVLAFYTSLYVFPNDLVLWFFMETGLNSPIYSTLTINFAWAIVILLPSAIAASKSKIILTSPKWIARYHWFVFFCLPFGFLASLLLWRFKLQRKQQFTSMATGFLKEAIDNRGILGHMFDTLFPGTHKSHSIHGKINDDKKYKGEKKLPAIKLDYLFMLAVLFQTKSPIVIDKPIEEETLFANDIALSKESKNRTKKLIKQARKRVDDYNKADRDNPFSGMSNKQVKQKIIEQVQPTSHKEKKEIKKLEKMAAKEKKQQEKINSLEKKRI